MILRSIEELQHKPGMVSKTACPGSSLVVFRVCVPHFFSTDFFFFFRGCWGRDGGRKRFIVKLGPVASKGSAKTRNLFL